MRVILPPLPPRPRRELYHLKAVGWPVRRRVNPTVVRVVVQGWPELARMVLWLEVEMGYRCTVHRLKLR